MLNVSESSKKIPFKKLTKTHDQVELQYLTFTDVVYLTEHTNVQYNSVDLHDLSGLMIGLKTK